MNEREGELSTALEPARTRGLGMLHVYSKVRQVLDIASYSTHSLEQVVYTTVPQLDNLRSDQEDTATTV